MSTQISPPGFMNRTRLRNAFLGEGQCCKTPTQMRPNTRLVHVETPTNPMMRICDMRAAADIAHEGDALLMVDSTFASPFNQSPLALGADVSMHSSTKYLNQKLQGARYQAVP